MAAEISNSETDPTKLQVTNMAANTDDEDHEDETYAYATQIAESVSFPMVMRTAIELDILGIMARAGPGRQLSAAEIPGVRNPDAPEMLDRMLYLLATYSVVTCTAVDGGVGVERRYGLAAVGKYFVPDEDGASMGPGVLLNLHEAYLLGWSKLKEAVLEGGIAFDKFHGMNAFEYPETDPSFNELFNKAMCASSIHTIKNIVKRYKGFDNIHKLVDVGGGLGYSLQVITCNYPSIKGINFDLSHVIQQAPPIQGVKHVGGDMFESVPQGDAIFMKYILHDWSDEHCLQILKNCYKALSEKGKVIVVEMIKAEEPETTNLSRVIIKIDLAMMALTPGGKERTIREFESLAMSAGFAQFNCVCYVSNFWVMEFLK